MKDAEHLEWMWGARVMLDGRYGALYVSQDTSRVSNILEATRLEYAVKSLVKCLQKNLLWVADLTKNEIGPKMDWIKVINKYESDFHM